MQNAEELQTIFRRLAGDIDLRKWLRAQLVNEGKISAVDLDSTFSPHANFTCFKPELICAIYQTLYNKLGKSNETGIQNLAAPSKYFTDKELKDARFVVARQAMTKYPLRFENVTMLTDMNRGEYLFALTFQDIYELSTDRMLHIRYDMQRETELIKYHVDQIPVTKYFEDKVNEIKESIFAGTQHPNTLRFHLLLDGVDAPEKAFQYDAIQRTLTIHDGILYNIDGNHRVNAIANAIYQRPELGQFTSMPVILTVGNAQIARDIIVQEEKRTPIDTGHVNALRETEGTRILESLRSIHDNELKLVPTQAHMEAGFGFLVEPYFADAITKSFHFKRKLTNRQVSQYASYIEDFLQEFVSIVEAKEPGYFQNYREHLQYCMSNAYTIYGMMDIAAALYGLENMSDQLEKIIQEIPFGHTMNKNTVNAGKTVKSFVGRYLERYQKAGEP